MAGDARAGRQLLTTARRAGQRKRRSAGRLRVRPPPHAAADWTCGVLHGQARDFGDAALDGIHQAEVGDDPREGLPLGVAAPLDAERCGGEIHDESDAGLPAARGVEPVERIEPPAPLPPLGDADVRLVCYVAVKPDANRSLMSAKPLLIPVRGTRYYQAGAAMAAGRLQRGTALRLVPRPDNPYDSTAVEIRLTDGTMLGHVPRERSAEFFAYVRAGRVAAARIVSAHGVPPRIKIKIEVDVEFAAPVTQLKAPPQSPQYPHQPEAMGAIPSPRAQPGLHPASQSQKTPPPIPAEGNRSWLWWVIGIILLVWLLAR